MAEEVVCLFNKYGFCKFKQICRNRHVAEVCKDGNCETTNCVKRHPRSCRYYSFYGRCKFSEFCHYSHDIPTKLSQADLNNKENEFLRSRVESIEKKNCEIVENLELKIKELEGKISEILGNEETRLKYFIEVNEKVVKETTKSPTECYGSTYYENV